MLGCWTLDGGHQDSRDQELEKSASGSTGGLVGVVCHALLRSGLASLNPGMLKAFKSKFSQSSPSTFSDTDRHADKQKIGLDADWRTSCCDGLAPRNSTIP